MACKASASSFQTGRERSKPSPAGRFLAEDFLYKVLRWRRSADVPQREVVWFINRQNLDLLISLPPGPYESTVASRFHGPLGRPSDPSVKRPEYGRLGGGPDGLPIPASAGARIQLSAGGPLQRRFVLPATGSFQSRLVPLFAIGAGLALQGRPLRLAGAC